MSDINNSKKPLIQPRTVSDSVYMWIKEAIINGDFKPGEHIPQESLTEMLGVSRTPVRDAIRRLEAEGLLVSKPHCGAIVFQATENALKEIYEVRMLLEQYCAVNTCLQAKEEDIRRIEEACYAMKQVASSSREFMDYDRRFHYEICVSSGCTNTIEILEGLWSKCETFKSIYFSLPGKAENTLEEHELILNAIKARNPEGVRAAIASHLQDVLACNYGLLSK